MISKLLLCLFNLNPETRFPFEGFDSRYSLTEANFDSLSERIYDIHYNKYILDQLNSTKLSIFDKLVIIENEQILESMAPNLYKSGLYDDWDFEI